MGCVLGAMCMGVCPRCHVHGVCPRRHVHTWEVLFHMGPVRQCYCCTQHVVFMTRDMEEWLCMYLCLHTQANFDRSVLQIMIQLRYDYKSARLQKVIL